MTTKKITLIYPFSYGYIDFVVKELKSYPEVIVTDIKTDLIKYSYPSLPIKIWNGITKLFGKNIKKEYFNNYILNTINGKQDIIFVIRPDLLELSLLKRLKENTKSFIAYYYDSCKKYPKQVEVASLFDEVYSYEKEDIKKYNFIETSNFIYDEVLENDEIKYDIFNVSSYDTRINEIDQLSTQLAEAGLKIYFVLFYFEKLVYKNLHSVTEYLSLQETKKLIAQSKAMIDIQRKDQKGLSFRTFESLGYRKKLITTNERVKSFDFYNPNNMLVINSEHLNIEEIKKFLTLPYVEIPKDILAPYHLKNFTKKIFKL